MPFMKCGYGTRINRDFPFNFIKSAPSHSATCPETLLHATNPIIQRFHFSFKKIPAGSYQYPHTGFRITMEMTE